MKISVTAARALAVSGLLLAVSMTSAHAYDANALLARLKAVAAEQGSDLAWTGVKDDGSTIVLEGLSMGVAGQPERLALGSATLSEITEENGGYKVGTVTLPPFSKTEAEASVTVDGISFTGMTIPAAGVTDPVAKMMMYEGADVKTISVNIAGKEVFALNQLHFELTPPEGDNAMEFSGAAEGFTVDLSDVKDPAAQGVINELGYQKISGYFEMEGSWQPKGGDLVLSQFDISAKDAGTLGLSFDLGGYTTEFIKSMQEMQKNMAANPNQDSSAQGMAMLGLMQQLSFNGAVVSFEDDSLTEKAVAYIAKTQGLKPSDLKNQAKALLPFALAQLNAPEFTASAAAAISKFLDDPKNLTIEAAPPSAVPFAMIMAGAMSAPQSLIKQLGVTVSANE